MMMDDGTTGEGLHVKALRAHAAYRSHDAWRTGNWPEAAERGALCEGCGFDLLQVFGSASIGHLQGLHHSTFSTLFRFHPTTSPPPPSLRRWRLFCGSDSAQARLQRERLPPAHDAPPPTPPPPAFISQVSLSSRQNKSSAPAPSELPLPRPFTLTSCWPSLPALPSARRR